MSCCFLKFPNRNSIENLLTIFVYCLTNLRGFITTVHSFNLKYLKQNNYKNIDWSAGVLRIHAVIRSPKNND